MDHQAHLVANPAHQAVELLQEVVAVSHLGAQHPHQVEELLRPVEVAVLHLVMHPLHRVVVLLHQVVVIPHPVELPHLVGKVEDHLVVLAEEECSAKLNPAQKWRP